MQTPPASFFFSALLAAAAAAARPAAAQDVLCFEAEAGTGIEAPMRVLRAGETPAGVGLVPGASGDAYIEVPEGAGKPPEVTTGRIAYTVTVPRAADYTLWCRVWWDDECGNSLTVTLDGGRPFTFGQDATYRCWHWVKAPPRLRQLRLEPGAHVLTLHNREDGVRIDQVLLTDDRAFVPVDIENVTTTPAPPAGP